VRCRCRADFFGKTLCARKHASATDDWHALVAVNLSQSIDELTNAWRVTRRRSKDNYCVWLALRNLLHDFILGDTAGGKQDFITGSFEQIGTKLACRILRLFRSTHAEQPSTIALGLAVSSLCLIYEHSQNSCCVSVGECSQLILTPHSEDHLHRRPVETLRNLGRRDTSRLQLTVEFAHSGAVATDAELKKSFRGEIDVESLTHGA